MALNMLFPYTQIKTREVPVPEGTVSGDPVKVGEYVGVALTDRGDADRTFSTGQGTVTRPSGGIGNAEDSTVIATDGVAIFPVAGVDGDTEKGTPVFITDGELSLTGTDAFGVVYGINNTAQATAVDIGVGA